MFSLPHQITDLATKAHILVLEVTAYVQELREELKERRARVNTPKE